MFNQDFYPTSRQSCYKLTNGINWRNIQSVLEPSAGKGDLADYLQSMLKTYHSRNEPQVDCIEINEDLQKILTGKSFRVIHDDYLTFRTFKKYDLICANFPFSDGEHHLLKALRYIDQNGGMLRCFVNAETIKNPYTQARAEALELLETLGAEIEFLQNEFTHSERKTSVEVALISVGVEILEQPSVLLNGLRAAEFYAGADGGPDQIVKKNYIEQLVANFAVEADLGTKFIEEFFGIRPFLRTEVKKEGDTDDFSNAILTLKISGHDYYYKDSLTETVNRYLQTLRKKYWTVLIRDPRFTSQYTSKILEELEKKLTDLKDFDFTVFNIRQLGLELFDKISAGINDSILALFDDFSSRWSYYPEMEKNIWYYNGWKSNKAHKINKKVIMPINGFSSYSSKHKIDSYEVQKRLADLVKVFNVLAAEEASVSNARALVGNAIEESNKDSSFDLDLRYFKIRFYKKGTAHITFTNDRLLEKLNIYGSRKKNWLPPNYGKVSYQEFSAEEKKIVDEFQGYEAYTKIIEDKAFYLVDSPERLMLGSGLV